MDDLFNVVQILLRLIFYMSGIFYSIDDRLEGPLRNVLLYCNPASMLIKSARDCMLYSSTPNLKMLGIWGAASVVMCLIGIKLIYSYENSYVKVM